MSSTSSIDYSFSQKDYLLMPLISPFAIRHFKEAFKEEVTWEGRIYHFGLGCFESLPVIGQIITLFEKIIHACFQENTEDLKKDDTKPPVTLSGKKRSTSEEERQNGGTGNLRSVSFDPENAHTKSVTPPEYLFRSKQNERGSQEGCRGGISVEKAKKTWQKLQQRPATGISFDLSIIEKCTTIIGTCTAMSLKFASAYFHLREEFKNLNPGSKEFQDKLCALKEKFEKSSEKIRSVQMAHSSITVDPTANIDTSKNKIESCIRGNDFEIDYFTSEIDIKKRELWKNEINDLPLGVYFIRMIKPATGNHKLEERAHSMIYVHEEDVGYFYDNNVGLERIPKGNNKGKMLYERLLNVHKTWDIPSMRFYRLEDAKNSL